MHDPHVYIKVDEVGTTYDSVVLDYILLIKTR